MSKKLNLVAQNRENNASVLPRRFALEPLAAGHRALPNDH